MSRKRHHNSVVILRLRGRSDLGSTFMDVLLKYATALRDQDSDLMLVSEDENMHEQLVVGGVADVVGDENIYTSDEWVGKTVKTCLPGRGCASRGECRPRERCTHDRSGRPSRRAPTRRTRTR